MQVICIKKFGEPFVGRATAAKPEVEDIDTVLKIHKSHGIDFYMLVRFGETSAYDVKQFAILNGPCEVEIAESRIAADAAELDAEWGRIVHENETA